MRIAQAVLFLSCVLAWSATPAAMELTELEELTELKPGPDPFGATLESRDVLTVDAAFDLSVELSADGFLIAIWRMPDGYYLYRHRFRFASGDGALGVPIIPDGQPKTDQFFGDVEVYYGEVIVRVPVLRETNGDIKVEMGYQGCADFGLCYPPQEKSFRFARSAERRGAP